MAGHAVVDLLPSEFGSAGRLLARAFRDDPVWCGLFPDPRTGSTQMVRQFTALLRFHHALGARVIKSADNAAVAVWQPPGRIRLGLPALRPAVALVRSSLPTPLSRLRFYPWLETSLAPGHKELVPEPHWYLTLIGTDPRRQGSGYGTALVQYGLDRADAVGLRVYLETETEQNVGYYEHMGFEVLRTLDTPLPACRMWLMVRPVAG